MQKIKTKYNITVSATKPYFNAVVVLSLLVAGATLLEWIQVTNKDILGYFLLAQGTGWMVRNFSSNKEA